MADQTGGQYYYGETADKLNDMFAEIKDSTVNKILMIESWGDIYYVRYDDYSPHLSYFTNILRIE